MIVPTTRERFHKKFESVWTDELMGQDIEAELWEWIESECQRREEEVREKANEIFRWLGGTGHLSEEWFPAKGEDDHNFYWRKRLREKIEEAGVFTHQSITKI